MLVVVDDEFEFSIAADPDAVDQCPLPTGLAGRPNTLAALPTRAGMLCVLLVDDALDVRAADAFWRTSVAHGTVAPPAACSMFIQMAQQWP